MATASDLIKSSLRLIGAIATGETPTSAESADALDVLNDILEEWSNDGFMIYEKIIEEFPLTGGTGTYSIGSGGTFDTARPIQILSAKVKQSGSDLEFPVQMINLEEWADIPLKTEASAIPRGLYYNTSYPLGALNLWPVPNIAGTLVLYSLKPLTAISAIGSTLTFPPGYKKALRYNLAVEVAPEFGKVPSAKVEQVAIESKVALQRTNTEPVYMESDAFGLTSRNFKYSSIRGAN